MRGCIPDPDPSFHRPPALLHQLTFLRQPPYCDYTVWHQGYAYSNLNCNTDNCFRQFMFPYPLPDQGFSFPPTNDTISGKYYSYIVARLQLNKYAAKDFFLLARNRGM